MSYVDIKKIDKFLGTEVLAAINQTSIDDIVPLAVAIGNGVVSLAIIQFVMVDVVCWLPGKSRESVKECYGFSANLAYYRRI